MRIGQAGNRIDLLVPCRSICNDDMAVGPSDCLTPGLSDCRAAQSEACRALSQGLTALPAANTNKRGLAVSYVSPYVISYSDYVIVRIHHVRAVSPTPSILFEVYSIPLQVNSILVQPLKSIGPLDAYSMFLMSSVVIKSTVFL